MISQIDIDTACENLKDAEMGDIADMLNELYWQYSTCKQDSIDLNEIMEIVGVNSIYGLKATIKELQCCANVLIEKWKDYKNEIEDWEKGYELLLKENKKLRDEYTKLLNKNIKRGYEMMKESGYFNG